jgi:hypothetical protein
MWGDSIYQHLQESLTVRADKVAYDADSGVRFERGLVSVPGAFAHLVSKLTHPEAFGLPLTLMAGLGLLLGLLRRETRWATFVLGAPVATFALLAALLAPYHVNPRHFNAVFGLLCPLAAGGVLLSAQALTTRRVALWAGLATGLLAAAVAARSAVMLAPQFRDDTRTLAYFWILQNLPRDARILVEDYGPILQPNERAIARLEARLAELPQDEAFTRHQSMRLSLLRRHPPAHRFDVVELGHAWWVAQETPDEELRASPYHRDMGNPLIHRTPKTLAEYRAEGVRYVVVNSMGMERYQEKGLEASFPSVMRFYAELRALEPIRVFDPEALDAKGPTIWIYDLAQPRERTR